MTDLVKEAIGAGIGLRCPDHDVDCLTCQTWDQFDALKAAQAQAAEVRRETVEECARIAEVKADGWWNIAHTNFVKNQNAEGREQGGRVIAAAIRTLTDAAKGDRT